MPKNKNTKRNKSLKAVPFVMTYHLEPKSMSKVILKYLDIFLWTRKLERCLPLNPRFHSEVQES